MGRLGRGEYRGLEGRPAPFWRPRCRARRSRRTHPLHPGSRPQGADYVEVGRKVGHPDRYGRVEFDSAWDTGGKNVSHPHFVNHSIKTLKKRGDKNWDITRI